MISFLVPIFSCFLNSGIFHDYFIYVISFFFVITAIKTVRYIFMFGG